MDVSNVPSVLDSLMIINAYASTKITLSSKNSVFATKAHIVKIELISPISILNVYLALLIVLAARLVKYIMVWSVKIVTPLVPTVRQFQKIIAHAS